MADTLTPRTEALAFRIWQFANPRGWDCSAIEIAEHLDLSTNVVVGICAAKGWHNRLRRKTAGRMPGGFHSGTQVAGFGPEFHDVIDRYRAVAPGEGE